MKTLEILYRIIEVTEKQFSLNVNRDNDGDINFLLYYEKESNGLIGYSARINERQGFLFMYGKEGDVTPSQFKSIYHLLGLLDWNLIKDLNRYWMKEPITHVSEDQVERLEKFQSTIRENGFEQLDQFSAIMKYSV